LLLIQALLRAFFTLLNIFASDSVFQPFELRMLPGSLFLCICAFVVYNWTRFYYKQIRKEFYSCFIIGSISTILFITLCIATSTIIPRMYPELKDFSHSMLFLLFSIAYVGLSLGTIFSYLKIRIFISEFYFIRYMNFSVVLFILCNIFRCVIDIMAIFSVNWFLDPRENTNALFIQEGLPSILLAFLFSCKLKSKKKIKSSKNENDPLNTSTIESLRSMWQRQINEIPFEELIPQGETVGCGSFGKVFKYLWNNEYVAVKVHHIPSEARDEALEKAFIREIELNCVLSHPHIIRFYGIAIDKSDTVYLVTEYHHDGDLRKFISTDKWIDSSWDQRLIWITQVAIDFASGMQYLHSKRVLHRDLNPTNLLVENKGQKICIYICDFGASSRMNDDSTNEIMGSAYYMAPEYFIDQNYTLSCDVYSFGCVLWELISEKIPHNNYRETEVKDRVLSGEYDPISVLLSTLETRKQDLFENIKRYDLLDKMSELIVKCIAKDPNERPTFESISLFLPNFEN